nr:unnamed protein product [Callosobruchus chinensis]
MYSTIMEQSWGGNIRERGILDIRQKGGQQ